MSIKEQTRLRKQWMRQEKPRTRYNLGPMIDALRKLEIPYECTLGIVFDDRRTERPHSGTFSGYAIPFLRKYGDVTTYERNGAVVLATHLKVDSSEDQEKVSNAIRNVQTDTFQLSQLVYLVGADKNGRRVVVPLGDVQTYRDLLPVDTFATLFGPSAKPYSGRTTIQEVKSYHGPSSKTIKELVLTCLGYARMPIGSSLNTNLDGLIAGTVFSNVAEGGFVIYERAVLPGTVEHEHWRYEVVPKTWAKSKFNRELIPALIHREDAFSFYFDTRMETQGENLQTKPVTEFDPPKTAVTIMEGSKERKVDPVEAAGIVFKGTKKVADDLDIPYTAWSSGSLARSSNRLHLNLDAQSVLKHLNALLEPDLFSFIWYAQPSQAQHLSPLETSFQTVVNGIKYGIAYLAEQQMINDGVSVPIVYNSRHQNRDGSVLVDFPVDSILPGSPKEIVTLDKGKRDILSKYPTANLDAPVTITMCVPISEPFISREEIFEKANVHAGLQAFNENPNLVNRVREKIDYYHIARIFSRLSAHREGFEKFCTFRESLMD